MKFLLLGAGGQVGWELQRSLATLGDVTTPDRLSANLDRPEELAEYIRKQRPHVIVNAAAYTAVDKAETEPDVAWTVNAVAPGFVARAALSVGAWIVHYSTDYVFAGDKSGPYRESDNCEPASSYGRSKRAGELAIVESKAPHLIFRTSWVHSPRGSNFVKTILRLAKERDHLAVVDDQVGAPTSAALIADVTALALYRLAQGAPIAAGIYHLAGAGSTSWYGVARAALKDAAALGYVSKVGPEAVRAIASGDLPNAARRPSNSLLDTSKLASALGVCFPAWESDLRRTVTELVGSTA